MEEDFNVHDIVKKEDKTGNKRSDVIGRGYTNKDGTITVYLDKPPTLGRILIVPLQATTIQGL